MKQAILLFLILLSAPVLSARADGPQKAPWAAGLPVGDFIGYGLFDIQVHHLSYATNQPNLDFVAEEKVSIELRRQNGTLTASYASSSSGPLNEADVNGCFDIPLDKDYSTQEMESEQTGIVSFCLVKGGKMSLGMYRLDKQGHAIEMLGSTTHPNYQFHQLADLYKLVGSSVLPIHFSP
jgi:hypothetical protein